MTRRPATAAVTLAAAGSVAVSTLVWSGYAGATERAAGTVHRVSDMAHMIAAAVWIGPIGAFHLLISPRRIREIPDGFGIAARSLNRFSLFGITWVPVNADT